MLKPGAAEGLHSEPLATEWELQSWQMMQSSGDADLIGGHDTEVAKSAWNCSRD